MRWVSCGIHETSFQRAWKIKRVPNLTMYKALFLVHEYIIHKLINNLNAKKTTHS